MIGEAISRWTMSYFAAALASLLMGTILLTAGFGNPIGALGDPDTLIVVHLLVIGWLALLFCGALLQFVPVLVAKPLRAAWVAAPALATILVGLACLISGFLAMGGRVTAAPGLLPCGALLLVIGFGALTVSFLATLASARPLSVPSRLVILGLGSLALTVVMGSAFATTLSGLVDAPTFTTLLEIGIPFHAGFGLFGWMTLTAIGVSYRLFTMFMLAPEGGPAAGRPALWIGMAAVVFLVISLLLDIMASPAFSYTLVVAIALTLTVVAVYLRDVFTIYRARRRKVLELNTSASGIALVFLLAGVLTTTVTFFLEEPQPLVASAFHLMVFGWLSGLGLGQLYKIVPFLTWLECYGPVMGKRPVPRVQDLVNEARASIWFWIYFFSVAAGAVCLALSLANMFRVASAYQTLAIVGLVYEYVQARRLACANPAIRLPAGAVRPHLIISAIQQGSSQ